MAVLRRIRSVVGRRAGDAALGSFAPGVDRMGELVVATCSLGPHGLLDSLEAGDEPLIPPVVPLALRTPSEHVCHPTNRAEVLSVAVSRRDVNE
jgi:hypothetical protein